MNLLVSIVLVWTANVAASPAFELGHYQGLSFTAVMSHNAVEIWGGNYLNCESFTSAGQWASCDVGQGKIVLDRPGASPWEVTWTSVMVLHTESNAPLRHYYYRGTAELTFAGQKIPTPVRATLTVEPQNPVHRLRGFVELQEQNVRTNLEARLVTQ